MYHYLTVIILELSIIVVSYVVAIFLPVVIGRRRAVKMLFFWGIASSQFDAVRSRRPGIRHYHSQ